MAESMPYPSERKDDSWPGAGPEHRANTVPSCRLSIHPNDIESLPAEPSLTRSVCGVAGILVALGCAGGRRSSISWQETSMSRPANSDLSQSGRVDKYSSNALVMAARVLGGTNVFCNVIIQASFNRMALA